jgi:hypothetical protein
MADFYDYEIYLDIELRAAYKAWHRSEDCKLIVLSNAV